MAIITVFDAIKKSKHNTCKCIMSNPSRHLHTPSIDPPVKFNKRGDLKWYNTHQSTLIISENVFSHYFYDSKIRQIKLSGQYHFATKEKQTEKSAKFKTLQARFDCACSC
jgi:hypothetical protein